MADASWTPPFTLAEKLKALLPPRLELARLLARELRKGEPELRLLPYLVDRRRAAIDVGANRGLWTEMLARVCPKIYAFEPNPKILPLLKAAARPNVECFAYGLSDSDGVADLLVPGEEGRRYSNQGATLNPSKVQGLKHRTVQVETRRLDSLAFDPVGFIKIDVEGHELAVVRGAHALIARDRPTLIVEIEERHTKKPLADALSEIASLGYRMLYLSADGLKDGATYDPSNQAATKSPRGFMVNNFIFIPV